MTEPRNAQPLLEVRDLTIEYLLGAESVLGTDGVSFSLNDGEAIGLVGESGSGKTTAALAIAGLLPPNGRRRDGEVLFRGARLPIEDDRAMRPFRWREVAIVFQGSMHALNPVHRVANQIAEPLLLHMGYSREHATRRVSELLELVGIPVARGQSYPHELSGGMRQRVMIAMALACEPSILIADEPTTALDVLTQMQILALLRSLRERLRLSLILITHDLSVVADACDRIVIMYAGRVVEDVDAESAFNRPGHPYTRLLLETVPDPRSGDRTIRTIPGQMPDIRRRPAGCAFHPRCPQVMDICTRVVPPLVDVGNERVACYLHPEVVSAATVDAPR